MVEAFLVGGARTPVGRYGGALSGVRPDDLGALVVKEAVSRAGIDPESIDEVVLGNANGAGEENRNVARMAVLLAGLPDAIPAMTVNRLCASGLSAIIIASQMIKSGAAHIVVAGGVESMSRAPWVQEKPRTAFAKPGEIFDTSIGWRFVNPIFKAQEKTTFSCRRQRRKSLPWTASVAGTRTPSPSAPMSAPLPPSRAAGSKMRSFPCQPGRGSAMYWWIRTKVPVRTPPWRSCRVCGQW